MSYRREEPRLDKRQDTTVVHDGEVRPASPFAPRHPARAQRHRQKRKLNGWQRIWLVCTALAWLGWGLLYPAWFAVNYNNDPFTWDADRRAKADYESGNCGAYINDPLETLVEPAYQKDTANCYHLYNSRKYDKRQIAPYTVEQIRANRRSERWVVFGEIFAFLSTLIALGSGLIYFIGWIISWIRKGFKDDDGEPSRRGPRPVASSPAPASRARVHSRSEEFIGLRAARTTNLGYTAMTAFFTAGLFWLAEFGSEKDLLKSHARGGGIVKLIEQLIGWELFSTMVLIAGFACAVATFFFLWKTVYTKPDLQAFDDGIDFHPAVKFTGVSYEDVDHWKVTKEDGLVLTLQLHDSYWSLKGIVPRKTLKFERSEAELRPIVLFWYNHPVMGGKLID